MDKAIDIKSLSVVIDKKQILTNITANVPKGKIVGLLGPSGAGKTTLIRAMLGLQKPSKGRVTVLGEAAGSKHVKSKVGYVTQSPSVYSDLTVQENIRYFANLVGTSSDDVKVILASVEMADFQNRLVVSLSGGQRARVSLAVALLGKPQLLLLDEPTVGLDPVLRESLWKKFRDFSCNGTTILISSHVMDEADKCDALMFMREGKLLVSDSKDNVLAKTQTSTMGKGVSETSNGRTK